MHIKTFFSQKSYYLLNKNVLLNFVSQIIYLTNLFCSFNLKPFKIYELILKKNFYNKITSINLLLRKNATIKKSITANFSTS